MASHPPEPASLDAVQASSRVIESAIALARAEARLALTRAGTILARSLVIVIALVVAIPVVQVTLAMLALAPLLGALESPGVAWLSLAAPLLSSALVAFFVYRAWRALSRDLAELSRGE